MSIQVVDSGLIYRNPKPHLRAVHAWHPTVVHLGGDRLLALYRRHDKPGLWATLAHIEGDTWVNLEEVPLWQKASSGMKGAGLRGDELSALKFGFPRMLLLSPGLVLTTVWCEEDGINVIRWLKIRV